MITPIEEARKTVATALDDLREVALHPRRYNVALEWVEREKALEAAISALTATAIARTYPDLALLERAREALRRQDEDPTSKGFWTPNNNGGATYDNCISACVALARDILAKIPPW